MGKGYACSCKKCKKEYDLCFEHGFSHDNDIELQTSLAYNGTYGEEWKKTTIEDPKAFVETNKYLYYCPNCHYFETDEELSIYKPNDTQQEDNILIKEYIRNCPKCNTVLEKKDYDDISKMILECPDCKETLDIEWWNEWD